MPIERKRKRTKVFKRDPMRPAKPALLGGLKPRDHSKRARSKDLLQKLPEDREDMVIDNHLLARKIAHDMVSRHNLLRAGESYDDIESEAFIGLIKAAMRFDPNRLSPMGTPVKFSSFAVVYIRGEILHYLRDRTYLLKISHSTKEIWQKGKNFHYAGMPAIKIAETLEIPLERWLLASASCSGPPMPIMDHAKLVDPPEVEETYMQPYIDAGVAKLDALPLPQRLAILKDLSGKTVRKLSPLTREFLLA